MLSVPKASKLSAQGLEALTRLEAQLSDLAAPENIAEAEAEYAQLSMDRKPSL